MKWLLDLIGLPSPYALLTYIVVAVGLFGAGTYTGWHEKSLRVDAANLKTETVAFEKFQAQEIVLNNISQTVETKLENLNVTYAQETRVVTKFIDRPVYRLECIDDDGLRSINRVLSSLAPNPGQPRPALSVTIPAGGKDGSGPDAKAGGGRQPSQ